MAVQQTGSFCTHCERKVLAIKNQVNHIFHLILTICTGGIWGIVWVLMAAGTAGRYRCSRCGSRV